MDTERVDEEEEARVTCTGSDDVVLPAASRAIAVKVYCPGATPVVSQDTEKEFVVSSAPRFVPLSWNCTPTTPILSVAVAVIVTGSERVVPEAGEVRDMDGGVMSREESTIYLLTSSDGGLSLPLVSWAVTAK
jgi:hypothetical protein